MSERKKIIDLELTQARTNLNRFTGYDRLRCLLRWHGTPVGWLELPVGNGKVRRPEIYGDQFEKYWGCIIREILLSALLRRELSLPDCISPQEVDSDCCASEDMPMVTVVVCTRDRSRDLACCLQSISGLDYPRVEVLVVDNAPRNDETQQLVEKKYPHYWYLREDRPGLNWARNCAIERAQGEIIAFTDDDTVVDAGWVRAIVSLFQGDPGVQALTGLVVPLELETRAQILFEQYGGFDRGLQRRWIHVDAVDSNRWRDYGTGQYGTGANMAFRKILFDDIGGFDPALDVGTVTNGGGDLEMFYRILQKGHTLVYEPRAIVRHCHRRTYQQLRTQIANNGIGLVSFFVRSCIAQPQDRGSFCKLSFWWIRHWYIGRLFRSFLQPPMLPRDLILVEFLAFFRGVSRYSKARKEARRLAGNHQIRIADTAEGRVLARRKGRRASQAVRLVDLAKPLPPLDDIVHFQLINLNVVNGEYFLGSFIFKNNYQNVGPMELADRIVEHFGVRLLDPGRRFSKEMIRFRVIGKFAEQMGFFIQKDSLEEDKLPVDLSVSIILATLDRPEALRQCLASLLHIETERSVEIIVVDNNPESGITLPVVEDFPGVKYLVERRRGLSYARNCGVLAASGQFIVTTDDDVVVPPSWLELLLKPFVRQDVAAVTGNVLPRHLTSRAPRLFELYGGLGRGPKRKEANRQWMNSFKKDAVPTWNLGATANAAFRAGIFSDKQIGLFNQLLGAGLPTGVGEDTELFYKILRAGHTIVYQPCAYVWHEHRETMEGLRRQLYSYSKGHVAYHLLILFCYRDMRSLRRILFQLPYYYLKQCYRWLRSIARLKRPAWPLSLLFVEIVGYLMGPLSLVHALYRAWRVGGSDTSK